jgi:CRP-like cAMP-binding protein
LLANRSNHVLSGLPNGAWETLAGVLERVKLDNGRVVHEIGSPIHRIYFPESSVLSIVQVMREGGAAEVGMIGREGVCGLDAILRDGTAPGRTVCQVPGDALAISSTALRGALKQHESLERAMLRYTGSYCSMLAQLIACNRLHQVEQRCARWLLMTIDRIPEPIFPMTQERLGIMLGAQRPTVTATMAAFREAGCLETSRGLVRITDRKCLESYACECYWLCASYFDL